MNKNLLPGLYIDEINTLTDGDNEDIKIPIFIGTSPNAGDATKVYKFKKWEDINKSIDNGGLGVYSSETPDANILLKRLYEFYEENSISSSTEKKVPYVYVIDLGKLGATASNWYTAMLTAKTKTDVQIEAYVGIGDVKDADSNAVSQLAIMLAAYTSIETETKFGNIRNAFFTVDPYTDAECVSKLEEIDNKLKQFTNADNDSYIQKSRIGIIEPFLYGKTIARICLTPYYIEPGYNVYRSVSAGTFIERTRDEELSLEQAGVIFNRDEETSKESYPKICRCVSTAYAADNVPTDALFHARFNCDNFIRLALDEEYAQIKNNETATNIPLVQSQMDALVDQEIAAEHMNEGTSVSVQESTDDAYTLINTFNLVPVNHTNAILNTVYIKEAVMSVTDNNNNNS